MESVIWRKKVGSSENVGMPEFNTFDDLRLVYDDQGEGPPIVLLHGFAADSAINWVRPGITDAIVAAGRRVIALDARGHGRSAKPHDPEAYADDAMVRDVQALLDHLGLDAVDVVGYSMGSLTTLRLLGVEPRVRAAVLGGVGGAADMRPEMRQAVANALEAEQRDSVGNPAARSFRAFADSTGADRLALAAIQRARRASTPVDFRTIRVPVLVVTGDRDELVGSPGDLAARIPGARAKVVSGNHLSAVNDRVFVAAVIAFLAEQDGNTLPA